jgi:hypothetical protein
MKSIRAHGLAIATVAALSAPLCGRGYAQEFADAEQTTAPDDTWYRSPAPKAEQPTIAREKAMARGQQRMARLEAMRWYGFSNSRPTAASMPYTTMYSPAWQQPGGRPFAWYTSSRPVVIYGLTPAYR